MSSEPKVFNSIDREVGLEVIEGADHGLDIDADGFGTLSHRRLYQLVRQSGAIEDRIFEIEFFGAVVGADAFTFG